MTEVTAQNISDSIEHHEGGTSFTGKVGVTTFQAAVLRNAIKAEAERGLKMPGNPWGLADSTFPDLVKFDEIGRCSNKKEVHEYISSLSDIELVQALVDGAERAAKRAEERAKLPPKEYRGRGSTDIVVHSVGGIFDITKEQVINLLICAIESGSYGSFYQVDSREPTNEEDIPENYKQWDHYSHCWGDGEVIFVEKGEYYDEDEDWRECEQLVLNEKTIKRGLDVLAKNFKKHFKDLINDNTDFYTGDTFLQCCLYADHIDKTGNTVV